jgi:uncharacterized membrane protein
LNFSSVFSTLLMTLIILVIGSSVIYMVSGIFFGFSSAKSFYFPAVHIEAEVYADGSMQVEERRTFSFKGPYSWVELWVWRKGHETFRDLFVAEGNHYYTFSDSRAQGSYYAWVDDEKMMVEIYFSAADEERTFTISYLVEDAVSVHRDVAELYWQFIGDGIPTHTQSATLLVTLPDGAAAGDLMAWGHGPLQGRVEFLDGRRIRYSLEELPANRFLEARVLFPLTLVPEAAFYTNREALPGILAEESEWARQADRERIWSVILYALGPLLLLTALAVALCLYWKNGRDYPVRLEQDYFRELPAGYTPAELGMLWNRGYPKDEFIIATILDLARRGYLRLVAVPAAEADAHRKATGYRKRSRSRADYKLFFVQKDFSALCAFEQCLLDFLKQIQGYQEAVYLTDIEEYGRRNPQGALDFFNHWHGWLWQQASREHNFVEKRGGRGTALLLGFVYTASGLALGFTAYQVTGFMTLIGGSLLFAAYFLIKDWHRSRSGSEQYARWKAFRRFLLHFSSLDRSEIPSLAVWEHYLVYAVVLGVSRKVLTQLQLVYPEPDSGAGRLALLRWDEDAAWAGTRDSAPNYLSGFQAFTGGMRQTVAAVRSFGESYQSSSNDSGSGSPGGGGGFSGGGGGGRGGGGIRAG